MAFGIISVSWENHSSFQGCLSNQMPASQEMFHDEQISSLQTHTHTHTIACFMPSTFHDKKISSLHTHTHTHTHEFLTKPWGPIWEASLLRADAVGLTDASLLALEGYLLGGGFSLRCLLSKVGCLKWGSKPFLLRSEVRIRRTPGLPQTFSCSSFSGPQGCPRNHA